MSVEFAHYQAGHLLLITFCFGCGLLGRLHSFWGGGRG